MINQQTADLTIHSEEAARRFFNHMNAIALGVEARYDLLTGYSRAIVETTIQTARQLGIPEGEIQGWKVTRPTNHSKVNGAIAL